MFIKKNIGTHQRAQTSMQNHLDESVKSQKDGIRKTIEIFDSEKHNSEQV